MATLVLPAVTISGITSFLSNKKVNGPGVNLSANIDAFSGIILLKKTIQRSIKYFCRVIKLDLPGFMVKKIFLFAVLFFFILGNSIAQCTLGQIPATSFPVCPTDSFFQQTVPSCGGRNI